MSDFSIVSLNDIDDMAPKFDLGDVQEARFATKDLGCEQTGLAFIRMKPNQQSPFAHHHGNHEELYVITAGSGTVVLDYDVREVTECDAIRVAPDTTRAFASGPDGMSFIAFGVPAMSDGKNEAEMEPADWSAVSS
jgi:mannose-6-phosphate isomerase-like protein (cupin superfamily)